jgi:hypothetical protein
MMESDGKYIQYRISATNWNDGEQKNQWIDGNMKTNCSLLNCSNSKFYFHACLIVGSAPSKFELPLLCALRHHQDMDNQARMEIELRV